MRTFDNFSSSQTISLFLSKFDNLSACEAPLSVRKQTHANGWSVIGAC